MKISTISLIYMALIFATQAGAQVIQNTAVYNSAPAEHFLRISYDNDYFTKTDYYYTQGISLELTAPGIRNLPMARLLIRLPENNSQYGITLDHFGYTPTSIRSNDILYEDRPYSGNLSFKTFAINKDSRNKQRLSTAFTLGITGPAAFGKEMQTGIHKASGNPLPQGWQHQIKNDIIINYQLNYEKQLWRPGKALLLSGSSEARIGTFQNRLSGGISLMAGHFFNPYQHTKPSGRANSRWQYYLYTTPLLNLVAYDASLQGGLFNRRSPYTIAARDLSRVTGQIEAGLVVTHGGLYLSYVQGVITREFRTADYHRWGGIRIGFTL